MEGLDQYERFIAAKAREALRRNRCGLNDLDDYIQIGRVAFLTARQNWEASRGGFPAFARETIRRKIMDAAVTAKFTLAAPVKKKRLALRARHLRSQGRSDQEIIGALNVKEVDLPFLVQLAAPTERGPEDE